LAEFSVAPDTLELARQMVRVGEVDALVAERVWQELSKGLMENAPSRMLRVLEQCGALPRILPELDAANAADQSTWAAALSRLDEAARDQAPLAVRYAILVARPAQPAITSACNERLRAPSECTELARLVAEHCRARDLPVSPEAMLALLEGIDALRRPDRAAQFAVACARVHALEPGASAQRLGGFIDGLRAIDAAAIADAIRLQYPGSPDTPLRIRDALRSARLVALERMLEGAEHSPSPSSLAGDRS
jgi:tRNA nucleotidyltransferase (CCA-adding enzyme)